MMVVLGRFAFAFRSYLPLPWVVLLLVYGQPSLVTFTFGSVVITLAQFIRFYSIAAIGSKARTTQADVGLLCQEGPYAWVRNPLYIANVLLWLGIFSVTFPIELVVCGVCYFLFQYALIVAWEEKRLSSVLGNDYHDYCQHVPRWVPKIPVKRQPVTIVWAKVLRYERSTLGVITALLIVQLTRLN